MERVFSSELYRKILKILFEVSFQIILLLAVVKYQSILCQPAVLAHVPLLRAVIPLPTHYTHICTSKTQLYDFLPCENHMPCLSLPLNVYPSFLKNHPQILME